MVQHQHIIDTNELSFSQKLLLDVSFLDDDWIAEHLNLSEMENIATSALNSEKMKDSAYGILRNARLIKRHKIVDSYIISETHSTYLIPNGDIIIDLNCEAELLTQSKFHKQRHFKITTRKQFHCYLEFQVTVRVKLVTDIELKRVRLTSQIL